MYISVIIPTYKPQEYIFECLHSLFTQSFSHSEFEVIIILNGCNEPYYSMIKNFVENKSNGVSVSFFQIDEGGVSNSRNMGLEKAKGNFIAFIDDDDYVSADYLEMLYKKAEKYSVVLSDALSFMDGENLFDENYPYHTIYKRLKHKNYVSIRKSRRFFNGPCMKLISRDVIMANKFHMGFKNGEDSIFMFQISKNIQKIIISDKRAVYYRRFRKNSATTSYQKFSYIFANRVKIIQQYTKLFFSSPFEYDFIFYVSRVFASMKVILKAFYTLVKKSIKIIISC